MDTDVEPLSIYFLLMPISQVFKGNATNF